MLALTDNMCHQFLTYVGRISLVRNLQDLLQNLFSDKPATLGKTYIESSSNDARYSIEDSSQFVVHRATLPPDCPDWVRRDTKFGPYEKEILAELLSSPEPLFAFRGGSGSGKSSLVSAIKDRTNILCNTRRSSEKKWSEKSDIGTFFTVLNFQSTNRLSIDRMHVVKYTDKLLQELFTWARDLLLSSIFDDILRTDAQRRNALEQFCVESFNLHGYIEDSKETLKDALPNLPNHKSNTVKSVWKESTAALNADEQINTLVYFAASVARQLRQNQNLRDIDTAADTHNVVLCLDNTDRVRPDLLSSFIVHLEGLFQQDQYASSGLKIVFFVRLSTSQDVMGALPDLRVRQFASPDAMDIILPKIVGFLYNEGEVMEAYPNNVVLEAKGKLLEFIIRVNDPYDKLLDLMFAIAGTNIRLFYQQLVKLLLDTGFKARISSETEFHTYLPHVDDFITDITFLRMSQKASSSLDYHVSQIDEVTDDEIPTFAHTIAKDVSDSLETLLSSQDQSSISLRGHVYSNEGLANVLIRRAEKASQDRRKLYSDPIFGRLMKSSMLKVAQRVEAIRFHGNASKARQIRSFVRELVSNVSNMARTQGGFGKYPAQFIETYIRIYGNYLLEMSKNTSVDEMLVFHRSRLHYLLPLLRSSDSRVRYFPPALQTRYSLTQILLGEKTSATKTGALPINLFSLTKSDYSPIPLKLIYALGCHATLTKVGERVSELRKSDLVSYITGQGHSKAACSEAIRTIASDENRLIYSTVMNNLKISKGKLLEIPDESVVNLSWSGLRYYEQLTENFHYIQWCLMHNDALIQKVMGGVGFSTGEGLLDDVAEYGRVPRATVSQDVDGESIGNFYRLLDFISERRRRIPFDLIVADAVTPEGREIVFRHRFPETDMFMKIAPDLAGVLRFQSSRSDRKGIVAQKALHVLKQRVREIADWGDEQFSQRVLEWDESLALVES